jgi:UDP-glucose 4-epimerase
MKILVTGGNGFIGRHLAKAIEKRGYELALYDRKYGQDVLDPVAMDAAVKDVDAVFHLAGILGSEETLDYIEHTIDVNIKGTLNVLGACRTFGKPMVLLSLKTGWHNPYLITKRCAAELAIMYFRYLNLQTAVVKALNVYGPGQHWGHVHKVVPTFIVSAIRGEPLPVLGDGKQIADLIYVSDLCEILLLTLERKIWGQSFDAGTGIPTRVIDLAEMIIQMVGSSSKIEYLPMRKGEPLQSIQLADPTQELRLLDFYPKVGLLKGMAETVIWYKEHYLEVEDRG